MLLHPSRRSKWTVQSSSHLKSSFYLFIYKSWSLNVHIQPQFLLKRCSWLVEFTPRCIKAFLRLSWCHSSQCFYWNAASWAVNVTPSSKEKNSSFHLDPKSNKANCSAFLYMLQSMLMLQSIIPYTFPSPIYFNYLCSLGLVCIHTQAYFSYYLCKDLPLA